ncbi:hypothetical protein ACFU9Y_20395 [Streptomyces sp. NPDC057621]|uniref:hypothetical protein n=1 Tax=Streptomyces sp. NPDC057621 TaxID=3346186 RepID=UPI0036A67639
MLPPGWPPRPGRASPERRGLSRRGLLGLAGGGVLLLAGCGPEESTGSDTDAAPGARDGAPENALGVNFNEEPSGVTPAVLDDLRTRWVRGFVALPRLDTVDAAHQPAIKTLLTLAEAGYATVLSLKFPFQEKPLPRPGTSAMTAELARVDKALDAVLDKIDILVVGNEPFLETRQEDRAGRLNPFYEAVAAHVVSERRKRFGTGCRTGLYMGALNRLEDPAWRTPAVDGWLAHVKATPEIEGVDIHPHVSALKDAKAYTDYVLPRIRPEQRFLATEFSLVHWWKQHWIDPVPATYADRYGVPGDTLVWQEVRGSAAHPLPQERWHDLLMGSPWFASRKDYLTHQVEQFRATGRLAVATYGTLQQPAMIRDIGPDKTPWLLNSLYANLVAQPSENGDKARNPAFYEDFRTLQNASDASDAS